MKSSPSAHFAAFVLACLLPAPLLGQISLFINEATANRFSISLNGTFETDVQGDQKIWVAVNPDASLNYGQHIEWIDGSVTTNVVENTILINGVAPNGSFISNSADTFGDSVYFQSSTAILAGYTISGTFTIQSQGGAAVFDYSGLKNWEVTTGFDNSPDLDWNTTITSIPVPEPAWTGALAAIGVVAALRRRKSCGKNR